MEIIEKLSNLSGPRDIIFKEVLESYNHKPVNVYQIGAIETLDNELFRIGSGWSDIIFGKYIKQFGGSLSISDISLDHLANSFLMSKYLNYEVSIHYGDGLNFLSDKFDIYYLDGSNDPKETLQQFNKILSFNKKNIHILIDDFAIKGTTIDLSMFRFTIHKIEKGLGVLYYG